MMSGVFVAMSEDNIRRLLVSGEEVILSDSAHISMVGSKLVLTNRRLFFCGAKGVFNREYVIKKEVDLKDIAYVRGDIGGTSILGVTGNSWLVVNPEEGEEWQCQLVSDSMSMWDFNMAQTQSASKVNNWVNSIKLELHKLEPVPPPPVAVATSEGKKFCRYCGAENKTDADFYEKCGKKIG
jgi:ribosomal protein L40E